MSAGLHKQNNDQISTKLGGKVVHTSFGVDTNIDLELVYVILHEQMCMWKIDPIVYLKGQI